MLKKFCNSWLRCIVVARINKIILISNNKYRVQICLYQEFLPQFTSEDTINCKYVL